VKQPVLPGRIAENMRRTIEKRSLVQRLDEGERNRYSASRVSRISTLSWSLIIAGLWTIRRRLACGVIT
jgi:hypothetical protein